MCLYRMSVNNLWALGVGFLVSSTVFASPSEHLQAKLNAMHTLTADFKQVVSAGRHHSISTSSGTMALKRPGQFRWQTKTPMAQLVVADGQKLWIYDVDLEQVSVRPQAKSVGGPAALFLSGATDAVNRDFLVTEKGSTFELHAKSKHANFQRVTLTFQGESLQGMTLFDELGQRTTITLIHVVVNKNLSSSLFHFKVPKGVDVVKQ